MDTSSPPFRGDERRAVIQNANVYELRTEMRSPSIEAAVDELLEDVPNFASLTQEEKRAIAVQGFDKTSMWAAEAAMHSECVKRGVEYANDRFQ